MGHDPPRGPSVDWRVLTTADSAGTNGLTCLPKHGGTIDGRLLVIHPMTDQCESLTLFEAGGGGPLPKNGQQWHDYRDGKLPDLPNLSREFNQLLKKMVDPDPTVRPSASRLRKHPLLYPSCNKSKSQLRRELAAAKMKNELLARKLQEAARCIKSLTPNLVVAQDSAKFRTRSAKRLQKPKMDSHLVDIMQSVSPMRIDRRTDRRGKKINRYMK
ncbi:hypothetical protein evm_003727 [Chilo suppressalis]|nr:hypothetical protein evm_003727 [Chilo suppressalis]